MNTFIQILENENDVSLKKLKQIYRIISKKVHPDIKNGDNEAFLKLQKEYEEALQLIGKNEYRHQKKLDPEEARIELLKHLYRFYLRIYSNKANSIIREMIEIAGMYNVKVFDMLKKYNEVMYKKHAEWKNDARTYYAHNVFLICIMQFFQCYNDGTELPKRVFIGHRQAIEGWSVNIKKEYKDILLQLYDWLRSELDNKHFKYYGI